MINNALMPCAMALTGALQDDGSVRYGGLCIGNGDDSELDRGRFLLRLNRWQADRPGRDPGDEIGQNSDDHICELPEFLRSFGGHAYSLIDYVARGRYAGIRLACIQRDDAWVGWDCLAAHESEEATKRVVRVDVIVDGMARARRTLSGMNEMPAREQSARRYSARYELDAAREAIAGEIGRLTVRSEARARYGVMFEGALRLSSELTSPAGLPDYRPDSASRLHYTVQGIQRRLIEDMERSDSRRMSLPGSDFWIRFGPAIIAGLDEATERANAALPALVAASTAADQSVVVNDRLGRKLRVAAREHGLAALPLVSAAEDSARGTGVAPDGTEWLKQAKHAVMGLQAERRIEALRDSARNSLAKTRDAVEFMKIEALGARTACQATIEYCQ